MNSQHSHHRVKIMTLLVIAAMLITPLSALADSSAAPTQVGGTTGFTQDGINVKPLGSGTLVQPKDAVGPATYVVQLTDVPLASYRGGVEGLEATNPKARGENKLDVNSPASQAYLAYLAVQRSAAIAAADAAIGRQLTIDFEYMATFNGYAANMTPDEAAQIAALPMVKRVEREQMFYPQTDAGPEWIGANTIWDGTMTGGLEGTYGEGIIVGVIDTGIDPWNPSFLATGDDGYTVQNPYGDGNYVGVCDPSNTNPPAGVAAYDPTFPCNSKLIGAWGYTASDPNPRDGDGHGSHTSSTTAGNVVYNTHVESPTAVYTASVISGVAPHANIIMYDGCIDGGGCPGASLDAARDQALLDGVDAINYSIGSGSPSPDPWNDIEEQQWLALRDAGVFCATSAGNAGPASSTIGSPADLPWITSVGASSHNRAFLQSLTLDDGVNAPITLDGLAMSGGYGPAPVVFAADYVIPPATATDARLCAPGAFPAGTFNGEIVVCERGTYGRVEKGQTVKDGGAGGYVLAQVVAIGGGPGSLLADPHVLPAIHIDYDSFVMLQDYITNAPGAVMGTLPGGVKTIDDSLADIMASFSSRGPNRGFFSDLIVPSVNAPGRDIWAAYHQGPSGDGDFSYNVISGTSMASPHVAGSGALMMALHPDWTPAEIQSALMTTAFAGTINDNGVTVATPFGQGSGRVQLGYAAQAGFVLDETTANYQASDPRSGGDPRTLNLASFGNATCVSECTWTRTLRSTMDSDVDWTASLDLSDGLTGSVTPSSFTLAAGGTQDIEVTVDVSGVDPDLWYFGDAMFMPDNGDVSMATMPIAVQPTTGDIPEQVEIVTNRDAGSQVVPDLTSIPSSDLTFQVFGLTKATQYDFELYQDPTNGDAYDNLDDVWWMTFDVPDGTSRIVAQTIASAASDIDMFWGSGDTPSAATQLGASTSGSWTEYLTANNPPAGTYWLLVQNWAGTANQPDAISAVLAVVDGDASNMVVEGPQSVGALEPFDIDIFWDADMNPGDYWYGAITLGSDPANLGDIGWIDVNLKRVGDDVSKTADVSEAYPGDMVNYTIEVQPNITNVDLAYTITDTIPAGMTYVPGSASATSGNVDVTGDTLVWTGVMPVPTSTYAVSTSDTDAACAMPLANSGAYVNLEGYGLTTDPAIQGDSVAYSFNPSGGQFNFFGQYQGEVINFTDDGFAFFDPSTPGGSPWVNEPIPTASDPNNLMAMFWRDMEIVYDAGTNSGVTLANLNSGGVPSAAIIEYDNIEDWPAGSGTYYDFEMMARYEASPDSYEYIFAYDNLNGDVTIGTIGLEDAAGTAGVQVAYDDIAVTDGMAICFDLVAAGQDPVQITYSAMVDNGVAAGTELTNTAYSITDNPGSMMEGTSATVTVLEVPPTEFEGMVTQTPSTNPAVMGTYLDVNVNATNIGTGIQDGLFLIPIDPDTEYVMGSAYGGAYPLTAAYAAQLAAEKGLTDLAAMAEGQSPDDVVAVAWAGEVPTGFNVDFGFATMVTNAPATVQYTAAIFDGATLISSLDGETVDVVDNSTYPVNRSMRFNVDRDSYINGTQPSMYYGSDQTMWVGFYDQMRPVVHTPLNGIATDSPVDQAWLYLYVTEGRKFGNWSQSVLENVTAHPATTEWMPYAVNWWMPWTMPGGDYGPGGVPNHLGSGKIGTWLRLDVTAAVQDMLRSGQNQGFLINSTVNASGVHYGLATKEFWDPSKLGYIRVYYRTAN